MAPTQVSPDPQRWTSVIPETFDQMRQNDQEIGDAASQEADQTRRIEAHFHLGLIKLNLRYCEKAEHIGESASTQIKNVNLGNIFL
jgi:hypothetical protein